jgi:hypothetical protein
LLWLDHRSKNVVAGCTYNKGNLAEFLRWTETADRYDRVPELVNIALKLNPDNLEAKGAGEDIKFSFKHT